MPITPFRRGDARPATSATAPSTAPGKYDSLARAYDAHQGFPGAFAEATGGKGLTLPVAVNMLVSVLQGSGASAPSSVGTVAASVPIGPTPAGKTAAKLPAQAPVAAVPQDAISRYARSIKL